MFSKRDRTPLDADLTRFRRDRDIWNQIELVVIYSVRLPNELKKYCLKSRGHVPQCSITVDANDQMPKYTKIISNFLLKTLPWSFIKYHVQVRSSFICRINVTFYSTNSQLILICRFSESISHWGRRRTSSNEGFREAVWIGRAYAGPSNFGRFGQILWRIIRPYAR